MPLEKADLSTTKNKVLLAIIGLIVIVILYLIYTTYLRPASTTTTPVKVPISIEKAVQEKQEEIDYAKEMENLREELLKNNRFIKLREFGDLPVEIGAKNKGEIFPKKQQ